MGMSNNPGQYADVAAVLDAALSAGGGHYRLSSHKEAVRWRLRAYHYRKLLFKMEERKNELFPGLFPSTPYDKMTLRIEPNSHVVEITFDRPTGRLTTLSGEEVSLGNETQSEEDELLEQARRIAEELGGD